jgi:hypothetical protein
MTRHRIWGSIEQNEWVALCCCIRAMEERLRSHLWIAEGDASTVRDAETFAKGDFEFSCDSTARWQSEGGRRVAPGLLRTELRTPAG